MNEPIHIEGKVELCLCGHAPIAHLTDQEGRLTRGKCIGSRRLFIRPILDQEKPFIKKSDDVLDAKRAEAIFNSLAAKATKNSNFTRRFGQLVQRGYLIVSCTCACYHLVDLGHVKLFTPADLRPEDIR